MHGSLARPKLVSLATVLMLLVAACGGGDGSIEPSTTDPTSATDVTSGGEGTPVGPAGGTVSSGDGMFTVEIPAGGVSETVAIGISTANAADLGLVESVLDGPVYRLTPDGLEFDEPAIISRTLSASALGIPDDIVPFFHVFQGLGEEWEPLSTETTRDGDVLTITAEIGHFSANVAVRTTSLYGGEVRFELSPAEADPTPVGGSFDVTWSFGSTDVDTDSVLPRGFRSGAVAAFSLAPKGGGQGTCGDTPGEGSYAAFLNFEATERDPIDVLVWFVTAGSARPMATSHSISAWGKVVCIEAEGPNLAPLFTTQIVNWRFVPIEGGPAGVEYSSTFDLVLIESATGRRLELEKQGPNPQPQDGVVAETGRAFFYLEGTDGSSYSEFTFGELIVNADGTYDAYGISAGGPPDLIPDLRQLYLLNITEAVVTEDGQFTVVNMPDVIESEGHRADEELLGYCSQLLAASPGFEGLGFTHCFAGPIQQP